MGIEGKSQADSPKVRAFKRFILPLKRPSFFLKLSENLSRFFCKATACLCMAQEASSFINAFSDAAVGVTALLPMEIKRTAAFGKNQGRLSRYLSYQNNRPLDGAGSGGRTRTVSLPLDFESSTSANSIIPAWHLTSIVKNITQARRTP